MGKTVVMFPGQGSQCTGMGRESYNSCTSSVKCFKKAGELTGINMEHLIFEENDLLVYRIVDIAMRMLAPRELYRAQGFPDTYVIAPECGGKPISKTAQVRMCGNSVPPQFVAALVTANGPGTWAQEAKPHLPLLAYLPPRRAGMEARV